MTVRVTYRLKKSVERKRNVIETLTEWMLTGNVCVEMVARELKNLENVFVY